MENNNQKGFATISTPDGNFRIWLSRPTKGGKMRCACSFGLQHRLQLVDALNALPYIEVDSVNEIDEDYSSLVLKCLNIPYSVCLEKLINTLPELMNRYLSDNHVN